jgi:two-component system LytT family response regulator
MLKVLLIDDEERATDALRLMIEKTIPEIDQVLACNDARLAAEMIHNFQPSLIFLDIQMPHINGFQLLERIPNKTFKIIFTTAYNEYAIKAIRFSAFDYLLKPVDMEELRDAVHRFLHSSEDFGMQYELLKNIMQNLNASESANFKLALPTREGVHFVEPGEIVRCEGIGNYTKIFLDQHKHILVSRTLAEYEALLVPYLFVRTHKSHLVNRRFISFIDHEGFAVLKDNSRIEVSRRRKEALMEAMK